ncbi:MAG: glycosyltransferase family 2 protein [Clostridia bacterium]|nr:glycosyltransferase family 2 protein [Clostridia bacterium]
MKQEILCVMCFYNEEKNLASCIRHLAPFVDGFVLLDDASTDKSAEIASRTPRLRRLIRNESKDSWRERTNRERVLRAALECAETEEPWVLCVDADERFETRFLKDLPKITAARAGEGKVLHLHTRELWGDIHHYRSDGIWNGKLKGCLFQLSKEMTFDYEQEHHIPWAYREIAHSQEVLDYNFYHLKMVHEADRKGRVKLYNTLDPEHRMQAIGYDYLADPTGLLRTRIPFSHRYRTRFVPKYYKRKK